MASIIKTLTLLILLNLMIPTLFMFYSSSNYGKDNVNQNLILMQSQLQNSEKGIANSKARGIITDNTVIQQQTAVDPLGAGNQVLDFFKLATGAWMLDKDNNIFPSPLEKTVALSINILLGLFNIFSIIQLYHLIVNRNAII